MSEAPPTLPDAQFEPTLAQLVAALPSAWGVGALVQSYRSLVEAAKTAKVNTANRWAMFFAQCAHESMGFAVTREIWGPTLQQKRYEPGFERPAAGKPVTLAMGLGNTQPGDGRRFAGHGWIQLTGRANHLKAGKALGVDLIADPEWAARLPGAALVSSWYWLQHNLNAPSDVGGDLGLAEATKRINGGENGLAERGKIYRLALSSFDAAPDGSV